MNLDDKIKEMTGGMVGERKFRGSLVIPEQTPDNYILGGGNIPDLIIKPDGNWTKVPIEKEEQNKKFDSYNCTSFNTLSQIEKMIYVITGEVVNYSDRALGIFAGTRPPGNDPHTVCEAIRKYGLVPEEMLPWTSDIKDVGEYYSWKGGDEEACRKAGQEWLAKWEFLHEWLFDFNAPMEKKLERLTWSMKRCPPSISVTAWNMENGVYVDGGGVNNHWTCKDGEVKNIYHIVRDSYLNAGSDLKLVDWRHNILMAKRYYLRPKELKTAVNWIQKLIDVLKEMVYALVANQPVPLVPDEPPIKVEPVVEPVKIEPVKPKEDLLQKFCLAIQKHEGWYPTSRSYRNNNPGNIRNPKATLTPYLKSLGAIGMDSGKFLIFSDYLTGFSALKQLCRDAIMRELIPYKKVSTIYDFFAVYAPSGDNNDPKKYAEVVALTVGLSASDLISKVL